MSFFGIKTKKERQEYLEQLERQERQRLLEKMIEEKREKEQQEVSELKEKYMRNSRTIQAAEDFANKYLEKIKNLNRDSDRENISCEYGFGRRRTDIEYIKSINETSATFDTDVHWIGDRKVHRTVPPLIDFYKENLQTVNDINAMALIQAISSLSQNLIIDALNHNPSDVSYILEVKDYKTSHEHNEKIDDFKLAFQKRVCYGVLFTYKAKNEKYRAPEPPKKWF